MRHHVSAAFLIALTLTFTFVSDALAEGTLSRVKGFFKGRTRTTITGTVGRDDREKTLKADDGKIYMLDGNQSDRLLEQHEGHTVRVTGYAQNDRFEVRRFDAAEAAPVVNNKAKTNNDDSDYEQVTAYDEDDDDEDIAPAPLLNRPGKPGKRTSYAYDDDDLDTEGDNARTYTVEKGDTLAGISKKFYGSTKHWSAIQKHNNIKDVRHIKPGMVLEIPAK